MGKPIDLKTVTNWKRLALWPHQVAAVEMVLRYRASRSTASALVRMPPGSGKTGIMAVLAQALEDSRDVLIVAPWAQLTDQIAKEVGGGFWTKLGAQPRKELKATVTFRPSTLPGLLKVHSKKPAVYVCTNQTLERLLATDPGTYRNLAERLGLVLVDEGHREPAPEWAKAVRGLGRPTVLFTATPYRNDSRLFNVDDSFVYRLPHAVALAGHFIRQVAFQETEFGEAPKAFVDKLLAFYQHRFLRSKPAGSSAVRVIVRCDTQVDVREVAAELRARKQRVVAVHENFESSDEDQTYRRVPDPRENDAVFWVHQFKLIEGVDDPDFGLLAIYQPLSNARALVQQVGRIIRNPSRSSGTTAYVFAHPRQKQARMWRAYLDYEDRLVTGTKELGSIGMARELLMVQNRYSYLDGNFREPFNPAASDFYEHIRFPLTTSVYKGAEGFQRLALTKAIHEMLTENDSLLEGEARPDRSTEIIVYARCSVSPLLSDQTFMELSLAFTIVTESGGYLFYFDSDGQTPPYLTDNAERVETDELERLMAGDEPRVSQLSLINTDLGMYAVRRRGLAAASIEQLAPGLGDPGHFCSTAAGVVEGRGGGRVHRYIGFTRSRISESSRNPVDYQEYRSWIDDVADQLQNSKAKVTPLFERYAANVRVPKSATPAHILLDPDGLGDFDLVDGTWRSPADGLVLDDLCSDVSNGAFECVVNGQRCAARVTYDAERGRFEIESPEMELFAPPPGPTSRQHLVAQLNQKQAFRIITDGGLVYAHGRFYKSRFNLWGRGRSSRIDLVDILVSLPALTHITSEKGAAVQPAGAGWLAGSLFEFIDRRGAAGFLASQGFDPDILICDDIGPELADFIAVRLDPPRIALIHAKHGDGGTISAKAFHVICSQAVKNLGVLTPQWEGPSNDVTRWNGAWNGGPIGRVARRIRVNRPNKGATELWQQIQQLIRQPSTTREVWIVMGDGMSRSAFELEGKRNKPRASFINLIYLLQSTWSAASSVGAQLKVFSRP
jgi:superfamily II DNA or RNA helicase